MAGRWPEIPGKVAGEKSGKLVVKADKLVKQFDDKRVVAGFSTQIKRGDRLGVLANLDDGSLRYFKSGLPHGPGWPAGSVQGPVAGGAVVLGAQMGYVGQSVRLLAPIGSRSRCSGPGRTSRQVMIVPTHEEHHPYCDRVRRGRRLRVCM